MAEVFVVHGQDHVARNQLVKVLKELAVKPVVFSRDLDHGNTIIEKFEYLASRSEFAIILLSPDDKGAKALQKAQRRARQNVIFEMGWFFGKLGRSKTLLIHSGPVELPSDVQGVLYKKFKHSPRELKADIAAAMMAAGIRLKNDS